MIEVTITGALYDKLARTMRPVVFMGEAYMAESQSPPGQADKRQFEYWVFYVPESRHGAEIGNKMNQLGAEGWYLCSTDPQYMYFVREIK